MGVIHTIVKCILYLAIMLISTFLFAQNNTLFEQGNILYNNGDYDQAIKKYESILETDEHSAEVYFNLANAHYKLNNIAPSIYYYEKALLLKPNDKEIKNNLVFAKNMTVDAIETVPEIGLSKFLNQTTNRLTFDSWSKLAIAFMFAFVTLIILYYFASKTSKKRLAFVGSATTLILACITLAFAFKSYSLFNKKNPAIVFAQETKIKNEPNNRSEEAFILHEGTKVNVLDSVNNWRKIKLSDGKTGWIESADIKVLNNF
ncbi:tetratricopeptide repeat protein [Lacinutrix salivirga]